MPASPPSQSLTQAIQQAANPAASSTLPTDPIYFSKPWDTYVVNGFTVPGVIALDGIRGFDRETVWDRKRGKGQRGAVLTLTQEPLAEGTITTWLWESEQFDQWDEFQATLLTYGSSKQAIVNALTIEHPALQKNGINNVVVGKVGIIRHVGKKLYSVSVEYIEWAPPTPATVVNTPLKAATVTAPSLPGDPPPAVAAAQADYFAASAAHAAAQGPPP